MVGLMEVIVGGGEQDTGSSAAHLVGHVRVAAAREQRRHELGRVRRVQKGVPLLVRFIWIRVRPAVE